MAKKPLEQDPVDPPPKTQPAIDQYYGNLQPVSGRQLRVGIDVDGLHDDGKAAPDSFQHAQGIVAKMASLSCIEHYARRREGSRTAPEQPTPHHYEKPMCRRAKTDE